MSNKVLVIQGAGMELRGTVDVDIFGPETFDEINARIEREAKTLGLSIEILHSTEEQDVVDKLAAFDANAYAALVINPAGFTTTDGPLPEAIGKLGIPAYEVHASNPAARGVQSAILPHCKGAICGFGYDGYGLALEAIRARVD